MRAEAIRVNGTYRMKSEVFSGSVQASGAPFTSPDVTIVRIKTRPGYKACWYFDAAGNAFEARDFQKPVDRIEVEL